MSSLKLAFVPAAGISKDWLRTETLERLEFTNDMFEKHVINHVFLSAKKTPDGEKAIEMMRDWLLRRDFPTESITCDASTPPGGDRTLRLMEFLASTSYTPPVYLYVVTSWYHMPRCIRQIKARLRWTDPQLPTLRGRAAVITRVKTSTPVTKCITNLLAEPFRLYRFYRHSKQE